MSASCANCRFSHVNSEGSDIVLECRRYPPLSDLLPPVGDAFEDPDVVVDVNVQGFYRFPLIRAGDWCGEFVFQGDLDDGFEFG